MSSESYGSQVEGLRIEEIVSLVRRRLLTVVFTLIAVVLAAALWVGSQTPVYRASATVLIEQDNGQNGLLSELASIGSAPAAASEIAILSSRSIAEKVVRPPVGAEVRLTQAAEDVTSCDALVLPGVGAFSARSSRARTMAQAPSDEGQLSR